MCHCEAKDVVGSTASLDSLCALGLYIAVSSVGCAPLIGSLLRLMAAESRGGIKVETARFVLDACEISTVKSGFYIGRLFKRF